MGRRTVQADFVADVGNSRIKWGRCQAAAVPDFISLPPEPPHVWQEQLKKWGVRAPGRWVVAGVVPAGRDALADWLRQQGHKVHLLNSCEQLPLRVELERPEEVGIDRLLNAVAANTRRATGQPVVIADAGSAVTVDSVDESGAFRGGAIFPGLRLMSEALHTYTALLPRVEVAAPAPALPGTSTRAAIQAGVYWAVVGGIQTLVGRQDPKADARPVIFLTGGDAPLLQPGLSCQAVHWPQMTLEGLRIAAETMTE
jgi:type III pantothenate kinase